MNLFCGATGKLARTDRTNAIAHFLNSSPASSPRVVEWRQDSIYIAYISDDGAVLGHATNENFVSILVGHITGPAPGWDAAAAPVDDPDAAAGYLLRRYETYGVDFLNDIHGQFAIAIIDLEQCRVTLGSDAGGGRRVFVGEFDDGAALFSTSLALLPALEPQRVTLDRSLEEFLLGFEFFPHGQTCYSGIRTIAPDTVWQWQDGIVTVSKRTPSPAQFGDELADGADENDAIEALYSTFMRILEWQTPTSKQVAVLLGGFDSALVAAGLVHLGKDVKTYSFHYFREEYNQPHTDTLERTLGTQHHWVPITPEVIGEGISRLAHNFNQPVAQLHYLISTLQAAVQVRGDGYHHAFTGDGCDGLFLGYPTVYRRARLIQRLGPLLPLLRLCMPVMRSRMLECLLGHPYRVCRNVMKILVRDAHTRGYIAHRIFDEDSLRMLGRGEVNMTEREIESILTEMAAKFVGVDPVRLAYLGKGAVGLNRNKLEGSSSASGVHLISPFLHRAMASFARTLPMSLLRPGGADSSRAIGKYILAKMAEKKKLLPAAIIYQEKRSPVYAPVDRWYQNELRGTLMRQIADLPFGCDMLYANSLVRPKLSEGLYRRVISIDDFTCHAICLLAGYAAFSKLSTGTEQ